MIDNKKILLHSAEMAEHANGFCILSKFVYTLSKFMSMPRV